SHTLPPTPLVRRDAGLAQPAAGSPGRERADQVELSDEARRSAAEPFRADLVARVRAEIEAGTYESEDKFEAILDKIVARYGIDVPR
ncbi:MAG: flagellar biosynthesis anti-sigma factor FlgM, partial [Phycisphaerae bacterium]|nr:flagellar biosynthesis anti-sigma factor FlgM [Phycisphaerae bacterium]